VHAFLKTHAVAAVFSDVAGLDVTVAVLRAGAMRELSMAPSVWLYKRSLGVPRFLPQELRV
jgi:hypothetical protein